MTRFSKFNDFSVWDFINTLRKSKKSVQEYSFYLTRFQVNFIPHIQVSVYSKSEMFIEKTMGGTVTFFIKFLKTHQINKRTKLKKATLTVPGGLRRGTRSDHASGKRQFTIEDLRIMIEF